MQVWFRVNNLLPDGLQKSLPDSPPEMPQNSADVLAGGDTDIGMLVYRLIIRIRHGITCQTQT